MMSIWMSFRFTYVFSAVLEFSYTIVPKMWPVSVDDTCFVAVGAAGVRGGG